MAYLTRRKKKIGLTAQRISFYIENLIEISRLFDFGMKNAKVALVAKNRGKPKSNFKQYRNYVH